VCVCVCEKGEGCKIVRAEGERRSAETRQNPRNTISFSLTFRVSLE
jgi:hypothetical protein